MKNTLLILLMALSTSLHCQRDSANVTPSVTSGQVVINMPEVVTVKNDTRDKSSNIISEKNMPWIVALLIGLTSAGINYYVAKRNEINLRLQLDNANKLAEKQFKLQLATTIEKEWVNKLREVIANLVVTTDPEYNPNLDKLKMALLINEAQLLLNESNTHKKLNALLNELGMMCDYWKSDSEQHRINILKHQGKIAAATKEITLNITSNYNT